MILAFRKKDILKDLGIRHARAGHFVPKNRKEPPILFQNGRYPYRITKFCTKGEGSKTFIRIALTVYTFKQ